jgi:hypothetical protein
MKRRLPITLGLLLSAGLVFSNATVAQEVAPVAPVPASEAPISVTLQSVIADMGYFAGQLVRIPEVRVREVISPRAVIVETGNMPPSGMRDDPRVLIVLDTPVSNLQRHSRRGRKGLPEVQAEANPHRRKCPHRRRHGSLLTQVGRSPGESTADDRGRGRSCAPRNAGAADPSHSRCRSASASRCGCVP